MEAGSRSRSLAVDCAMVDARMRTRIRVDGELYGGVGGLSDHHCGKLQKSASTIGGALHGILLDNLRQLTELT